MDIPLIPLVVNDSLLKLSLLCSCVLIVWQVAHHRSSTRQVNLFKCLIFSFNDVANSLPFGYLALNDTDSRTFWHAHIIYWSYADSLGLQ